jgi:(E)-2-((N-methylformamido)methylene)succinate hydrolase
MVANGIAGDHFRASLDRWFTDASRAANAQPAGGLCRPQPGQRSRLLRRRLPGASTTDLAERPGEITAETFVMTGEHDQGSNPRMAPLMHARITGSILRILPVLRHSILAEAPEVVAGMLDDFLAGRLAAS